MFADTIALLLAMGLALFIRFDSDSLLDVYSSNLKEHLRSLPLVIILYLIIFSARHLYRYVWRYASLEILWGVVSANVYGIMGCVIIQLTIDGTTFPRSVLIIFALLATLFVGGVRLLLRLVPRLMVRWPRFFRHRGLPVTRVVILGGEADGVRLLSALREEGSRRYEVVGILDDSPTKHGAYIRGVRVLGPISQLNELLDLQAVDEVLVAFPSGSKSNLREYVMACRKRGVLVKVVPGLREVLGGKMRPRLEDISLEDLLRRPPVCINTAALGGILTGKRVMVTGAGGSIGSELCRQIIAMKPKLLVLFGHGENSVHNIQHELQFSHPELADRLRIIVGSTADEVRMSHIFALYRPHVVFHAAAHKHVPIMENNVPEAVQNNVLGTRWIAEYCGKTGTERMVLISTDKAVEPSSVMGATKWLCEEVVRATAARYKETTYITVRFGNVLGSRGSVVPIFQEQIRRGEPVTVTHHEMTRFFMTIPEAVQLVLQAGAVGRSEELYVLDMGEPVRILDLACDTIRLSGYEPDVDVQINFTGLRPGEKMHEMLTSSVERLVRSAYPDLLIVERPRYFTQEQVQQFLRDLEILSNRGETDALLALMYEIIPSFHHQCLSGRAPKQDFVAVSDQEVVTG